MDKGEIKDAILKMHFKTGDVLFVDARLPLDAFISIKSDLPFFIPVVPVYRLGFYDDKTGKTRWESVETCVRKMSRKEVNALLEVHGA